MAFCNARASIKIKKNGVQILQDPKLKIFSKMLDVWAEQFLFRELHPTVNCRILAKRQEMLLKN